MAVLTYDHPALAWETQSSLSALYRTISGYQRNKPDQVTIVCGAGVSADAGLPGWHELVNRMATAVMPAETARAIKADPTDPMRKVEYVFRAAPKNRPPSEIVRDALYLGLPSGAVPGRLADSVARLVKVLGGRAQIITTNFDDSLEAALSRYFDEDQVKPFGSNDAAAWKAHNQLPGRVGVLHLHGQVAPGKAAVEPLILSETHFLEHGPLVRALLHDALQFSAGLFVGISLDDPNVIGPLRDLASDDNYKSFIITVPEAIANISARVSFSYNLERASYLQSAFGTQAVNLKSYSQVAQLIYDLSFACRDPGSYFSSNRKTSTRYGHRFGRQINAIYRACGVPKQDSCPRGEAAARLSDSLHAACVRRNGPGHRMRELARGISAAELNEYGLDRSYISGEKFALFLWLRNRAAPDSSGAGVYSLRAMTTILYNRFDQALQHQ